MKDVIVILGAVAQFLTPLAIIIGVIRSPAIVRTFMDRTKLVNENDILKERIKDKDQQISDLTQTVNTGRLSADGLRDQITSLNTRIGGLEQRIEDLSHKLDIVVSKYDCAIRQIIEPDRPVPLVIVDDIDHMRRHMTAS